MRHRRASLALLIALLAAPVSAQLTGTWEGTYTLTHAACPGAFHGPAALYLTQSGALFTGAVDMDRVTDEPCEVSELQLVMPVSGSVSGSSLSGMILGPFEAPFLPFSGTVAGNTMTASFSEGGTSVTLALARSSSASPASAITGTYAGTYAVTDTMIDDPCANLPSYSYSGPLTANLVQAGPLVAAVVDLREMKDTDHDENGNCTIIDAEDIRVGMMATMSGSTITGVIMADIVLPFTATVSGETIAGSTQDPKITFTFTLTRTSAALAPVVVDFAVDPPVIREGESATLRWSVFNATSVAIDRGIGTQPVVGTATVSPSSTTTYTLTAAASSGATATAQTTLAVAVEVEPPQILSFTATPSTIDAGACSSLAWTTANATSISIDHGIGSRPPNGSATACPPATTTYTLTATGPSGTATDSLLVTVTGIDQRARRRSVGH